MSTFLANRYWLGWSLFLLVSFLVPEVYSLIVHRPGGTLSETVWRMEGMHDNKFGPWTAAHLLFTGELILIDAWLICHFGWGLFR